MNSILISTPMGRGSERGLSFYGTGKQTVPSPDNEKDDRRTDMKNILIILLTIQI